MCIGAIGNCKYHSNEMVVPHMSHKVEKSSVKFWKEILPEYIALPS